MIDHRNSARGENEWADTYGSLGIAAPIQQMQLPLHVLDPWTYANGEPQPFDPYTPAMLADLAENIRRNGVIQPITVRPRSNGRFQIIAGHHRVAASKIAGLPTVPALVRNLDDDTAGIWMIDSNIKTRPPMFPSARARVYKKRMQHLQNLRTKNMELQAGGPLVHPAEKGKSRDIIAQETGANARQIQRYLRLNDLHPRLLKMVDNGSLDKEQQDKNIPAMALRAGVELSYIPMEQQELLLQVMLEYGCKAPSMAQAGQLRSLAAAQELDEESICSVMVKTKSPKPSILKLPATRISSFFPPNTLPEQMEAEIYDALLAYRKNQSPASV